MWFWAAKMDSVYWIGKYIEDLRELYIKIVVY